MFQRVHAKLKTIYSKRDYVHEIRKFMYFIHMKTDTKYRVNRRLRIHRCNLFYYKWF